MNIFPLQIISFPFYITLFFMYYEIPKSQRDAWTIRNFSKNEFIVLVVSVGGECRCLCIIFNIRQRKCMKSYGRLNDNNIVNLIYYLLSIINFLYSFLSFLFNIDNMCLLFKIPFLLFEFAFFDFSESEICFAVHFLSMPGTNTNPERRTLEPLVFNS